MPTTSNDRHHFVKSKAQQEYCPSAIVRLAWFLGNKDKFLALEVAVVALTLLDSKKSEIIPYYVKYSTLNYAHTALTPTLTTAQI